MDIEEARQKILAIFADTVKSDAVDGKINDAFMVSFIEKTIASCNETCRYDSPETREGVMECFEALKRSVLSFSKSTHTIAGLTRDELPKIDSIMEASSDEKVQKAARSLRHIHKQLQEEIEDADQSIKLFQNHIETIQKHAHFDHVTKLLNAYSFVGDLLPILRVGERRSLDMGLLAIRVENYDTIMVDHGQAVLNKLLIYLTRIIREFVRQENKVYRYSYNTFYVLFNRSSAEDMNRTLSRIRGQLGKHAVEYNKKPVPLMIRSSCVVHKKGDTVTTLTERLEHETKEGDCLQTPSPTDDTTPPA